MIKSPVEGKRAYNAIFGKATIINVTEKELTFWLDDPLFDGKEHIVNDDIDNDMWIEIKTAKLVDVSKYPKVRTTDKVYRHDHSFLKSFLSGELRLI